LRARENGQITHKYGFTAQELAGIRGGNLVRVLDEARKGARK
jgi:hypothetical protein